MIIVDVYSPAVDAEYDFQIDEDINTADAARLVSEMIARKNGSSKTEDYTATLYEIMGERQLDPALSLRKNKVISGMHLLLV